MPSQRGVGGPPSGSQTLNPSPQTLIKEKKLRRLLQDAPELAAKATVQQALLRLPLLSGGRTAFVCRGAPQGEKGAPLGDPQGDLQCVVFECSSKSLQQQEAGRDLLEQAFRLTKENMEGLYQHSKFLGIGWADGTKREELSHKDAFLWLVFEGTAQTCTHV